MKQVNQNDLVNWWLENFHNTNLDKIKEENPSWKEDPPKYTDEFHKKYKVTLEQYLEWQKWAKEYIKKVTKLSKKTIDKSWWAIELDCSPSII